MGLTSAVHWWEESQMRVLVLSSLIVQSLLFISTLLRRRNLHRWMRSMMWLVYLAGDAVAIYALATLFNRHKPDRERRGGDSSILEVVWAPVLLIHLGGHEGITAYNIEDNELWSRHLLTTVSQVTVAIYVFCKSWPANGEKKLLAAAIMLFVLGVLKCFAKPWALKSASINSLVSLSVATRTPKQRGDEMCPLEKYVEQAKAFVLRGKENEEHDECEARQGARAQDGGGHPPSHKDEGAATEIDPSQLHREACNLFVDLSSSYDRRLRILEYFWVLSEEKKAEDKAYVSVRGGLARAFLLYTKVKTAGVTAKSVADSESRKDGCSPKLACYGLVPLSRVLPFVSFFIFRYCRREAYDAADVKITNAVLILTAVLEICSVYPIDAGSNLAHRSSKQWPELVAQYSLAGYLARSKNHGKVMRVASLFGFRELLDQRWCMPPHSSSRAITGLVLGHLKDGWMGKIQDAASYRRFNDSRGHWALVEGGHQDLCWSIKGPFDESVILWHVATDLCFFSRSSKARGEISRQMSNYMMHLLFVNPEMLLPGTRRNLFTTAYDELMDILRDNQPAAPVEEKVLMARVISTMNNRSKEASENESKWSSGEESMEGPREEEAEAKGGSKRNFIDDAWAIAQNLLKNDEKMWGVIQGVWVEMLCYSAGRCRGYLHAKALGSGGEFLSYVWLLQTYMGMETLTERLQREELPSRHEGNSSAGPLASDPRNGTALSTPEIRNHNSAAPSAAEVHDDASPSTTLEIHIDKV